MSDTPRITKDDMNDPIASKQIVDSDPDCAENEQPMNRRRAEARLRQGLWEADQFLSFDEIREYVERVLREIESDRP